MMEYITSPVVSVGFENLAGAINRDIEIRRADGWIPISIAIDHSPDFRVGKPYVLYKREENPKESPEEATTKPAGPDVPPHDPVRRKIG